MSSSKSESEEVGEEMRKDGSDDAAARRLSLDVEDEIVKRRVSPRAD